MIRRCSILLTLLAFSANAVEVTAPLFPSPFTVERQISERNPSGGVEHQTDPITEFYARFVSHSFRHRVNRPVGETSGTGAGVYIRPTINGFTSLEFSLTREQKETAVLEAFRSTVHSLAVKGLVRGKRLEQLFAACQSFEELERLYLTPVMSPVPAPHRKWWQVWRRRNSKSAASNQH